MPTRIIPALSSYKIYLLGVIGAYSILITHDGILYSHLGVWGVLELAGLRLLLLLIPVLATLGFLQGNKSIKFISAILWIFFIPYTLYSLLEVRHISEICRLSTGYFTQHCSEITWQVLPSFIYGLMGLGVFVWSIYILTKKFSASMASFCVAGAALYIALTSMFGIFTRINTWELVVKPFATIHQLEIGSDPSFWINVVMLWACFSFITIPLILWKRQK